MKSELLPQSSPRLYKVFTGTGTGVSPSYAHAKFVAEQETKERALRKHYNSVGIATHTTRSRAIIHALYELIERYVIITTVQQRLPVVPIESVKTPPQIRRDLYAVPNPWAYVVLAVFGHGNKEAFYGAARSTLRAARLKALKESYQRPILSESFVVTAPYTPQLTTMLPKPSGFRELLQTCTVEDLGNTTVRVTHKDVPTMFNKEIMR
jgi:hypothetical protein